MAAKLLSSDEIALGRAVLLATDTLAMNAEGALWLYDKQDDEWRFFLVTSLFERIDPREVYVCLNEALAKILSEKEADDLRLYIAAPTEELVKQLLGQITTASRVTEPQHIKVRVNGKHTDAFVYRLARGLAADQAKSVQRRFRRSCRELAATS